MEQFELSEMEKYKIMKLVDEIHEIMDYIDDGYHNKEIACLVKISNELIDRYEFLNKEDA